MAESLLTIYLFSFGYRYSGLPEGFAGPAENGADGGFVFDCRALPNPYWDEVLRPFTGRDPEIRAYMARHPEVEAFAGHAAWLVRNAARAAAEKGQASLRVAFGCTGGRHRSVYQAERLRRTLEGAGYRVAVRHIELKGPGVTGPRPPGGAE